MVFHFNVGLPKLYVASAFGVKLLVIRAAKSTVSVVASSPKLMSPVAVIVPVISILPVPIMLLPFKSKFCCRSNVEFIVSAVM